jgi:hypothetical protein
MRRLPMCGAELAFEKRLRGGVGGEMLDQELKDGVGLEFSTS